jgi:hypothetical protein
MQAAMQQRKQLWQEKPNGTNQSIFDITQGDPQDSNPINKSLLQRPIGQHGKSRWCGNLSNLECQIQSVETGKNTYCPVGCVAITIIQWANCVTSKPLHFFPNIGKNMGKNCFLVYHNDNFFGLAVDNCKVMKKRKSDWDPTSAAKKKVQVRHIEYNYYRL